MSDYFGCYNLGNLYNNGRGVKKDYSKANIYYEKACNLNNDIGCFNVGVSYNLGEGVKKTTARQIFIIRKPAI